VTRGGSSRFSTDAPPSDLSYCDQKIAEWPSDLQQFAPDLVIVATGPTNTIDRQLPGESEWRSPGDPALDSWLLGQMQQDVDVLHQTGVPVVWLDLPYEQRDHGELTGATLLDSSDPARIDHYNQLLDQLESSRPVSILRWSKYFDALSVDQAVALYVADGIHLKSESTQMVLDQWMWAELRNDYLAGRSS
jgi:hypothetical protein